MFSPFKVYTNSLGYRIYYTNENGIKKIKLEHRLIMENYLSRKLTDKEVVDHIDGDRSNNSINNLRLCKSNKINNWYYHGISQIDEDIVVNNLRNGLSYRKAILGTNIKSIATAWRIAKEYNV